MPKIRTFLGACLLAIVLLAPAGANAARALGDAAVAYRADRVLTIGEQRFPGKLIAIPGRQRHEQAVAGLMQVAILDFRASLGYFIVPAVSAYLDFPIGTALQELSDPDLVGSPQGSAQVNGVATTKYRVSHRAPDGTRIEGFVWLTAAGIPMRGDGAVIDPKGKRTPVSWELSNLQEGPQDPQLFAPPRGFYRLPAGALPGFLSGAQ